MFGREPQFPVDFLVGSDKEGDLSLEEWVEEHQKSLAAAYESVQQRVDSRMSRRDLKNQDLCMAPDFEEGDLVYTRNNSVRGRNKIQDFWDPKPYRVVRQPFERGLVYSIAPAGQEGPLRQVHRVELRSVPGSRGIEGESQEGVQENNVMETDVNGEMGTLSESKTFSGSDVKGVPENEASSVAPLPGQDTTKGAGTPLVFEPRKSARKTAGQHSNPFKMPQSEQTR